MEEEKELTDEERELLEEQLAEEGSIGSPQPTLKDNIFKFFRTILTKKDPTRVGNLKDEELGKIVVPIRTYLQMANYADSVKLNKNIVDYLNEQAYIIAGTSMSRKGFFAQLLVTQIKREQKIKDTIPKKQGFFSQFKKPEGEGGENE